MAAEITQSKATNTGERRLKVGAGHDETALGGICEETVAVDATAGAIETGGLGSATIPATAAGGGSIATTPAAGGGTSAGTGFDLGSVTCATLGVSMALFGTTSCSEVGACGFADGVLGRVAGMPAPGVNVRGAALGREGFSTDSVEAAGREGVLARGAAGELLGRPAVTWLGRLSSALAVETVDLAAGVLGRVAGIPAAGLMVRGAAPGGEEVSLLSGLLLARGLLLVLGDCGTLLGSPSGL
jgi:hypothetical protein